MSSLLGCNDSYAPIPHIAEEKPRLEISPKTFFNPDLGATLYTKLFSPKGKGAYYCETYVENPSGRTLSGTFKGS